VRWVGIWGRTWEVDNVDEGREEMEKRRGGVPEFVGVFNHLGAEWGLPIIWPYELTRPHRICQ